MTEPLPKKYDEWKLASPYEPEPELPDEGDLVDEAYDRIRDDLAAGRRDEPPAGSSGR